MISTIGITMHDDALHGIVTIASCLFLWKPAAGGIADGRRSDNNTSERYRYVCKYTVHTKTDGNHAKRSGRHPVERLWARGARGLALGERELAHRGARPRLFTPAGHDLST